MWEVWRDIMVHNISVGVLLHCRIIKHKAVVWNDVWRPGRAIHFLDDDNDDDGPAGSVPFPMRRRRHRIRTIRLRLHYAPQRNAKPRQYTPRQRLARRCRTEPHPRCNLSSVREVTSIQKMMISVVLNLFRGYSCVFHLPSITEYRWQP